VAVSFSSSNGRGSCLLRQKPANQQTSPQLLPIVAILPFCPVAPLYTYQSRLFPALPYILPMRKGAIAYLGFCQPHLFPMGNGTGKGERGNATRGNMNFKDLKDQPILPLSLALTLSLQLNRYTVLKEG
jgi:hypothetical protein